MSAAVPEGGGGGGAAGTLEPPEADGVAEFEIAPVAAGSGLPTTTPGAAPRAAPAAGSVACEPVSPVMRRSRSLSGVAVSPPATGTVPVVAYDAGSGGIGPEDDWATGLLVLGAPGEGAGVGWLGMPSMGSPCCRLPTPLSHPANAKSNAADSSRKPRRPRV